MISVLAEPRFRARALTASLGLAASPPSIAFATTSTHDRVVHETQSADAHGGGTVHRQRWRGTDGPCRGSLLILHGLLDHSGRYDAFARRIAGIGIGVYALDHRGHGNSSGERGFVDDFDAALEDVDALAAWAQRDDPGPMFVLGHSMGGAIATEYALTRPGRVAGLVLSAAALANDAPRWIVKLVRRFGRTRPHLRVLGLPARRFSRDPQVVRAMKDDPLVDLRKVPARTAAQIVDAVDHIQAHAAGLDMPLLVLHGRADRVTPPSGSERLVAAAGSSDKRLVLYDDLVHDLLHEPEHERVEQDIEDWLRARCG